MLTTLSWGQISVKGEQCFLLKTMSLETMILAENLFCRVTGFGHWPDDTICV
jgi:hypothetical protein